MNNFRVRLIQLRDEHRFTQKEVADVLGYGYTAVANYESGRNEPCIDDLIKLAILFDVSVDYLVGYSDEKKQPVL
mgnify:CR=1 FL=1